MDEKIQSMSGTATQYTTGEQGDIWIANAKFEWDYNKLYDTFYGPASQYRKCALPARLLSESNQV